MTSTRPRHLRRSLGLVASRHELDQHTQFASSPINRIAVPRLGDPRCARRARALPQLALRGIIAVWAAAALPMGLLAWVVAPLLADQLSGPAL